MTGIIPAVRMQSRAVRIPVQSCAENAFSRLQISAEIGV